MTWDDFDTLLAQHTVEVAEDPSVLRPAIVETAINETDIKITDRAENSITGVETPFRDWLERSVEDDFTNDAIFQRPLDVYDRHDEFSLAIQHEVGIEERNGVSVLTESVRMTHLGRTLLVAVLLLTGLLMLNFLKYLPFDLMNPSIEEIKSLMQLLFVSASALLSLGALGISGKEELISIELFEDDTYASHDPMIWPSLAVTCGVVVYAPGLVLEVAWLRNLGGLVVIAAGIVTQYRYDLFQRYRMDVTDSLGRYVPTINLQYIGVVVGFGVPIWALQRITVPESTAPGFDTAAAFVFGVALITMLMVFGTMLAAFMQTLNTYRLYSTDRHRTAPLPIQLFGSGVAVLASCLLVVGVGCGVLRLSPLVTPLLVGQFKMISLLGGLAIVVVFAPTSFLIAGLGAQAIHTALNYHRVWQMSRLVAPSRLDPDIDDLLPSDVQLRVVNWEDAYAASLSYGFGASVVLSRQLIDELTERELRAVVAHEVAHFEHWDAFLSFYVPIVATVLFTGRNVLYSALDFRSREFRADAFAADVVGKDALESALRTAGRVEATSDGPVFPTGGQALVSFAEVWRTFTLASPVSEPTAEFYRLYYGGFALTEAHPSVEERIRALNQ